MSMNKQGKLVQRDGLWKVMGGIEWLKVILADLNERRGYSWNVIGGCLHKCQWQMPNGNLAECYAKTVAENVASLSYPEGFEHHYFHPERLLEPFRVKTPSRIFPDSMADLFGHWVPDDQLLRVMGAMSAAHWHTFLMLTKNPVRYKKVIPHFTPNMWLGASTPPDHMFGKELTLRQKEKMFTTTIESFSQLPHYLIKWLSIEPLSWDVAPLLAQILHANPFALQWMVIGAASDGSKHFQPNQWHLNDVLAVADRYEIPVFFKGNLDSRMVTRWREEFPHADPLKGLAA